MYYNVMIIKCTINVMCLNHPETIFLSSSAEKLSSTKPVPGAKKVGDCCFILSMNRPEHERQTSLTIFYKLTTINYIDKPDQSTVFQVLGI